MTSADKQRQRQRWFKIKKWLVNYRRSKERKRRVIYSLVIIISIYLRQGNDVVVSLMIAKMSYII